MSGSEEEYSEEEQISIEEKTAIVRYFINNAPPGHTDKIVEAVRTIGAADVLTEEGVATMLREYNLANFKPVQLPDGTSVVICPQTEVAAGEFLQPSTGKVITFDHVTGGVGEVRDATAEEIGESGSAECTAIQKAMEGYLAKAYHPGDSAVTVTSSSEGINIVISAEKIKHDGGCWSGRWKSEWTVKDGNIDGTTSVMSHYYEQGNVQMHNLKDFAATAIDASDPAAVAKHVEKSEAALHGQFDKMYSTMTNTTFKELRRQLPVTGMKFNWANPGVATMRQVLTKGN